MTVGSTTKALTPHSTTSHRQTLTFTDGTRRR
jgi:hypothetical protein